MAELAGIFSDIMNLKDCVGFSDSLILPQQVKTYSGGYLAHGVEGIGGMPYTDGRRRGCSDGSNMFSVESCQFTSGAYHFSDAPIVLGHVRTPPAVEQREESS